MWTILLKILNFDAVAGKEGEFCGNQPKPGVLGVETPISLNGVAFVFIVLRVFVFLCNTVF